MMVCSSKAIVSFEERYLLYAVNMDLLSVMLYNN